MFIASLPHGVAVTPKPNGGRELACSVTKKNVKYSWFKGYFKFYFAIKKKIVHQQESFANKLLAVCLMRILEQKCINFPLPKAQQRLPTNQKAGFGSVSRF